MNVMTPQTLPVVAGGDGAWDPSPEAMGPFGGLHGGVVSGVLTGELEARAAREGWGQPVSATVYLVRPAPPEPFTTQVETVRAGARLSVVENALIAGGKLRAKASMAFLGPVDTPGVKPAPDRPYDPSGLPEWQFAPMVKDAGNSQSRTFLAAVDVREDRGGRTIWVRPTRPLTGAPTGQPGHFSQAIAIADFATLFGVYLDGERPPVGGWPNADISVHLARLPEGPWIGVKPRSSWYPNGTGLTEAELFDTRGWIGRSCQSVVLLPAGKGPMA